MLVRHGVADVHSWLVFVARVRPGQVGLVHFQFNIAAVARLMMNPDSRVAFLVASMLGLFVRPERMVYFGFVVVNFAWNEVL